MKTKNNLYYLSVEKRRESFYSIIDSLQYLKKLVDDRDIDAALHCTIQHIADTLLDDICMFANLCD